MNRKPNRQHEIREIVNLLAAQPEGFTVRDVIAHTQTTRQAAHRQLARLVETGVLVRVGNARATRYLLGAGAPRPGPVVGFERRYARAGLAEDQVWNEVAAALPALASPTAKIARAAMAYALTEMVNNAIDHSGASVVVVRAGDGDGRGWFEVRDEGIGAFENVRVAAGLPDALAGLQEISKGKHTTQPAHHSGEGIFFTSKMADQFELSANGLAWIVDNARQDHAVAAAPPAPGTTVRFEVSLDKGESPEEVFARYTHDFEFDTTRTVVKLFSYGVRFVSRSEAKRLLETLDRFRHVIIDFAGVEAVGQGFADEVFRVWAQAHPTITLTAENMSPPVAFMVGRARGSS